MIDDIIFEDETSNIQEKKLERFAQTTVEHEKARQLASDSTKEIPLKTKRKTLYFVNMADLHIPEGNMLELIEKIIEMAKVPGMLIGLGGDVINNAIKNSVGDTHGEVVTPEDQIKLFANLLKIRAKKENIDLNKVIAYIRSGNHENRSVKEVAIDPAYVFAEAMGMLKRYAKNTAKVVISQLNKNDEVVAKHVIVATHAEQKAGKAGAQAEDGLVSDLDYGADVVIYEHNHKVMSASQSKEYRIASRVNPFVKTTTFVNFGAHIAGGEYADRAGYTYPRKSDKEVLRLSFVNQQKKYDFINYRSLVNSYAEEAIKKLESTVKTLEQGSYKSKAGITKQYSTLATQYLSSVVTEHNFDKESRQEFLTGAGLSDRIYFAPISGFDIGNEDSETNEKEIEEKIATLAKLNGSCYIALNGNIVHYKKAFTLVNKNGGLLGEKFPEESFSYIEKAAKFLAPVKNKIKVMVSGENEKKLMKYQSQALAKMGMNRLQMPESQCYMPYNKIKLETEKLKIQAQKVEQHNKDLLADAVGKALKNVNKAIEEALPYKVENWKELTEADQKALFEKTKDIYEKLSKEKTKANVDKNNNVHKDKPGKVDEKLDFLKDLMAPKLRAEGVFLNLVKDADFINWKYKLEDIELRTPHENLVWNMMCAFLEIDPKNVAINAVSSKPVYSTAKLKDERGRTRTVEFFGGFANSKAGRSSIESNLKGSLSASPGAHVYYTNTKLGKEFVLLEKQIYENPFNNKTEKKDAVFISGGTFSKEVSNSVNKIYKIFAVSNKQEKEITSNIYDNTDENFKLYCESLNYETVLLDKDVMPELLKNIIKRSHSKTVKKFNEKEMKTFMSNSESALDKSLDKVLPKDEEKTSDGSEMQ